MALSAGVIHVAAAAPPPPTAGRLFTWGQLRDPERRQRRELSPRKRGLLGWAAFPPPMLQDPFPPERSKKKKKFSKDRFCTKSSVFMTPLSSRLRYLHVRGRLWKWESWNMSRDCPQNSNKTETESRRESPFNLLSAVSGNFRVQVNPKRWEVSSGALNWFGRSRDRASDPVLLSAISAFSNQKHKLEWFPECIPR